MSGYLCPEGHLVRRADQQLRTTCPSCRRKERRRLARSREVQWSIDSPLADRRGLVTLRLYRPGRKTPLEWKLTQLEFSALKRAIKREPNL